jgi:hypothetical protein
MGLNLIWEWHLTNRQTTVCFRSIQTRLRIGHGTLCLCNCRSCCRLILAPCATACSNSLLPPNRRMTDDADEKRNSQDLSVSRLVAHYLGNQAPNQHARNVC